MLIEIVIGVGLLGLAVVDILYKRIPVLVVGLLILLASIGVFTTGSFDWVLTLGGGAVGLVFVGVSKITKEGIGYGDSLLILALGIYLGFWEVMVLIMLAFFLSAIFAVFVAIIKKKGRKATFPMVPFIAFSYVVMMFVLPSFSG
jgi:leader peptidase (prepilin peptidase)/N-methyltransferase